MMAPELVTMSDGCRLWTSVSGDGDPVVFLHGPGLWDSFGELAAPLSQDYRVCRWDQRGCGRSERPGGYRLARVLADLAELLDHWGFPRATLVGHSWGAELALRFALDMPERVTGLVYLSGVGLDPARPVTRRRISAMMAAHQDQIDEVLRLAPSPERDRQLRLWRTSFAFPDRRTAWELANRILEPYLPFNEQYSEAMLADQAALAPSVAGACAGLAVPTLVVHGAEDLRPPAATDSLVAALPRARRVVVEGAGPYPWMDRPGETLDAIRDFLADSHRWLGSA